jgi:hypothetical protein
MVHENSDDLNLETPEPFAKFLAAADRRTALMGGAR